MLHIRATVKFWLGPFIAHTKRQKDKKVSTELWHRETNTNKKSYRQKKKQDTERTRQNNLRGFYIHIVRHTHTHHARNRHQRARACPFMREVRLFL